MNPSPPLPLPATMPAIDATCDRIVASLTRRLADAARRIEESCPPSQHDFLVPVMHPEMTESLSPEPLSYP